MSPFMVTDLQHFETGDPGVELTPQAQRLKEFLGTIARAGSVRGS